MYYKIFVLAFLITACQESINSLSNKSTDNQSSTAKSQSMQNKIQENKFEKESVTIRSERKKTNLPKAKKTNSPASKPNSTTNKESIKENEIKKQEVKNEYEQKKRKWNKLYSEDSTWLDLYNTSEASFIKGWENEFIKSPNIINTINKPFLVQLFYRKMEKIFYNSPSFIQFSVDKFAESATFTDLQIKWNIPN
ncbi:MAG: hypothetical protein FJZ66_05340 [Bacteroidetes bacterium]|nr:hypothetical protein [Bacteroidota bacterium]MBM3455089.1 hypothetical protein [Bacteroidota bacterium]